MDPNVVEIPPPFHHPTKLVRQIDELNMPLSESHHPRFSHNAPICSLCGCSCRSQQRYVFAAKMKRLWGCYTTEIRDPKAMILGFS